MKRFFKKLSFVLAAAMVVTMVPAQVTKAADLKTAYLVQQDKTADDKEDMVFLNIGGDVDFKFIGIKDYATTGKGWTSSNTAVATVDKKGLVTAKAAGTTVITYTATGYEPAQCTVVVLPATVKNDVQIVDQETGAVVDALEEGQTVDYKFIGCTAWKTAKSKVAVYKSSNEKVLECVNPLTGEFVAKSHGDATVTLVIECDGKVVNSAELKVTVKVPETQFKFAQVNIDTVRISFDAEVAKVEKADITTSTYIPAGSKTPVSNVVKDVKLAEDKMSADIIFYNAIKDGVEYQLAYQKRDVVTIVGSVGEPVAMTVDVKSGKTEGVAYAGEDVNLVATLYDANGVDVTKKYQDKIVYNVEIDSADGYSYDNDKVYFFEKGKTAVVTAKVEKGSFDTTTGAPEYYAAEFANSFTSIEKPAFTVSKYTFASFDAFDKAQNLTITLPAEKNLNLKFATSEGEMTLAQINADPTAFGTVTFMAANPDNIGVYDSGKVVPFIPTKDGEAEHILIVWELGKDKRYFDVPVVVRDYAALKTVTPVKSTVTVKAATAATASADREGKIEFTTLDQYGEKIDVTTVNNESVAYKQGTENNATWAVAHESGKVTVTFTAKNSTSDKVSTVGQYEVKIGDKTFTVAVTTLYATTDGSQSTGLVVTGNKAVNPVAGVDTTVRFYDTLNGVATTDVLLAAKADTALVSGNVNDYVIELKRNGVVVNNFVTSSTAASGVKVLTYVADTDAADVEGYVVTAKKSTATTSLVKMGVTTASTASPIKAYAGTYTATVSQVTTAGSSYVFKTIASTSFTVDNKVPSATLKLIDNSTRVSYAKPATIDKAAVERLINDRYEFNDVKIGNTAASKLYYDFTYTTDNKVVYLKTITVYAVWGDEGYTKTEIPVNKTFTFTEQ